jgi:AsmA family
MQPRDRARANGDVCAPDATGARPGYTRHGGAAEGCVLRSLNRFAIPHIMWSFPVRKLKRAAFGILIFLGIALLAGILWVVTLDLNRYKATIEQALQKSLARDVRIDGDIQSSLRPLGLKMAGISINDRAPPGGQNFVKVAELRVGLDMGRLLFERLWVLRGIVIQDTVVTLRKDVSGQLNIADLLANPAPRLTLPAEFDNVVVKNLRIVFADAQTSKTWTTTVEALTLAAVRLQQPLALVAKGRLEGLGDVAEGQWQIETALTLNAERDQFELHKTRFTWTPLLTRYPGAVVNIEHVIQRRANRGTSLQRLAASMSGGQADSPVPPFALSMNVGSLSVMGERIVASDIAVQARHPGRTSPDTTTASVRSKEAIWEGGKARLGVVVEGQHAGDFPGKALLKGDLTIDGQQVNVANLQGEATLSGTPAGQPASPSDGSLRAVLSGGQVAWVDGVGTLQTMLALDINAATLQKHQLTAQLQASFASKSDTATARMSGTLDGSALNLQHRYSRGSPHSLMLELERLDLARWIAPAKSSAAPTRLPDVPLGERLGAFARTLHETAPILRRLPVQGRITLGEVIDSRPPGTALAKGVVIEFE